MKKISFIFGTRPEAIKLCPLIAAFRTNNRTETHVCVTGQHRQLLDQVLEVFAIEPDLNLALMEPDQSLALFASRAITSLDKYLAGYKPDLVLVQGDTTTVFCASLASFYNRIPVGHVEAGLRTWNKYSPFPEEINRVLTTRLSDYHFAPTSWAKKNLLNEGAPEERIFVTGNTVIDALYTAIKKVRQSPAQIPCLEKELGDDISIHPIVLITGHRRENFGQGFENICMAIAELAHRFPQTRFIYPVHLNPNVREPVFRILGGKNNIYLIEPLSYLQFVMLMDRCTLILTDSGGVQEEAPSLGKPVLVMRDTTERPEAVEAGTVRLVGTDKKRIVNGVTELLTDHAAYNSMSRSHNPYGDGKASERILAICEKFLTETGQKP